MEPKSGLIGYWIPIEVGANDKLSFASKYLFSIINSLDITKKGCFATNSYLMSKMNGMSNNTLVKYINELIEHEYITREVILKKDSQTERILRINPEYLKKYNYLRHQANHVSISQLNEELYELTPTGGGGENSFMGGDPRVLGGSPPRNEIHNSILVTLESESEEESKSLLRKDSLTLPYEPCGSKEKLRSKLIRRTIEVKPVTKSKLIRRQSVTIKNTPITQEKTKPVIQTELKLSPQIELIVNEWEDGLKIHNHTTKTFKQAISYITKLLKGTMFKTLPQFKDYENKKFTPEEIIQSIANFKLAALSPDYHPIGNLKTSFQKTSFPNFFYNSFSLKYQSLFIEFLNNPPKSVIENGRLIADVYPQLSQKLRKLYVENVLGNPDAKLPPQSENAFRRAAMKLNTFKDQNKKRILITEVNGNLANYLWEALENKVRNTSDITPNWFCSDKTFQETFPAYLYSQGVLQSLNEKEFSIYN